MCKGETNFTPGGGGGGARAVLTAIRCVLWISCMLRLVEIPCPGDGCRGPASVFVHSWARAR